MEMPARGSALRQPLCLPTAVSGTREQPCWMETASPGPAPGLWPWRGGHGASHRTHRRPLWRHQPHRSPQTVPSEKIFQRQDVLNPCRQEPSPAAALPAGEPVTSGSRGARAPGSATSVLGPGCLCSFVAPEGAGTGAALPAAPPLLPRARPSRTLFVSAQRCASPGRPLPPNQPLRDLHRATGSHQDGLRFAPSFAV